MVVENAWLLSKNMFPNMAAKEELKLFRKHITSLAALDFRVCLRSDEFKKPHDKILGRPFLGREAFRKDLVISYETRAGCEARTFSRCQNCKDILIPV